MNKLIIILIALCFYSCKKDEITALPDCIQIIINDAIKSPPIKEVKSQNLNGDLHYWLVTGAREFDGSEYIVDNKCDTLCFYCGFCIPPSCILEYSDDWETIWQK